MKKQTIARQRSLHLEQDEGEIPDDRWPEENILVCYGKEEAGQTIFDQPGFSEHIVGLFITGNPPIPVEQSAQECVDWIEDSAHSYVNDGYGGLSVVAHPKYDQKSRIKNLRGLSAIEIAHLGSCGFADKLWDELLRDRFDSGQKLIWGVGADDTHSTKPGNFCLSWTGIKVQKQNTWELKRSMRKGAIYASNGPKIQDIYIKGKTITIKIDKPVEVRWLKSGQYFDDFGVEGKNEYVFCPHPLGVPLEDSLKIVHPDITAECGANKCLKIEKGVKKSSYTLNDKDGTTSPEKGRYIRCIILDVDDLAKFGNELKFGDRLKIDTACEERLSIRKACSMPVRILSNKTLHVQYPSSGRWITGSTHNHSDLPADRIEEAYKKYFYPYIKAGHKASFETGYSYWFSPYVVPYPSKVVPYVKFVKPDRCREGTSVQVKIFGDNFGPDAKVYIGKFELSKVERICDSEISAIIPYNLFAGIYDLTVVNPNMPYKHTLCNGFIIQEAKAENTGWELFSLTEGLPDSKVYCIRYLEGKIYAGTRNGVAYFDHGRWVKFDNGPVDAQGMDEDKKGNLWVSGWHGLFQCSASGVWNKWETEKELHPAKKMHDVICASNGNIYVSYFRSPFVSVFDGERWHTEDLLYIGTNFAESPEGEIILGSAIGPACRRSTGWKERKLPKLPVNAHRRVYFDPYGRIVVATAENSDEPKGGVCILQDGKWKIINQNQGLPHHKIWSVAFGKNGTIWAATSKGLARIYPDLNVKVYTVLNSNLPSNYITDVLVSHDSKYLWVSSGRGVASKRLY